MIPAQNDKPIIIRQEADLPSRTYFLDLENRAVYGKCDGLAAIKQACEKILQTERYEHLIYSPNFGAELAELFGQPVSYGEIERRITEALLQDGRIRTVDGFTFEKKKGAVACTFTVHTAQGAITLTQEVRT